MLTRTFEHEVKCKMAARTDAAAPREISESECLVSLSRPARITYSREALLNMRKVHASKTAEDSVVLNTLCHYGIKAATTLTTTLRRKKWRSCKRKQQRGKQAGIHAWLKANPTRPAVLPVNFYRILDSWQHTRCGHTAGSDDIVHSGP